jgi:hypothetical protein
MRADARQKPPNGKIRLHDFCSWVVAGFSAPNQCAMGKPKDKEFQEGKEA